LALSNDDSDLEDRIAPVLKAPTSGGSTGRPKLILSGSAGVTQANPTDPGLWRLDDDDIGLLPAPLYHNGPFGTALAVTTQGGHLVLMPRFDPEATLRAVEQHRATWIYLVPTMMSRIWRLPEEVRAKYDLSSLRTLWHLAAPCPPWLKEAWIEWLGPEVIMELYAGTEAQAVTTISGTEWLAHRGSVGQVRSGEMRAVDEAPPCRPARSARSTCAGPRTPPRPISIWAPPRGPCLAAGSRWATSAGSTRTASSIWPIVAPT